MISTRELSGQGPAPWDSGGVNPDRRPLRPGQDPKLNRADRSYVRRRRLSCVTPLPGAVRPPRGMEGERGKGRGWEGRGERGTTEAQQLVDLQADTCNEA